MHYSTTNFQTFTRIKRCRWQWKYNRKEYNRWLIEARRSLLPLIRSAAKHGEKEAYVRQSARRQGHFRRCNLPIQLLTYSSTHTREAEKEEEEEEAVWTKRERERERGGTGTAIWKRTRVRSPSWTSTGDKEGERREAPQRDSRPRALAAAPPSGAFLSLGQLTSTGVASPHEECGGGGGK